MKILVLKNTPLDVSKNFTEATDFFFKHKVKLEFVFKTVNIPVTIRSYKEIQGFNPTSGLPSLIKYYGVTNTIPLYPNYDLTLFCWDLDTAPNPTDGAITSWTTDYVQLAINKYLIERNKITNRITHEIMHFLCVLAERKGFRNTDEMDLTHEGKPFFKNDDPEALDGNYALTFKNLQPYLTGYQYFSPAEVAKWKLKPEFWVLLDKIRGECGFAFNITSGLRTKEENDALADSVSDSAHLSGLAVDLFCIYSDRRFKMVEVARKNGITRIGIGKTFIHFDIDPTKSQNVIWHYYT